MFKDTFALKIHNCDICITNLQHNTSGNSLRYKLRNNVKSITKKICQFTNLNKITQTLLQFNLTHACMFVCIFLYAVTCVATHYKTKTS